MRDSSTYRAARRNDPLRGIPMAKLSGDSWKKEFSAEAKYRTPSKKERYLIRKYITWQKAQEAEKTKDQTKLQTNPESFTFSTPDRDLVQN